MSNLSLQVTPGRLGLAAACALLVLGAPRAFAERPPSTEFGVRTFSPPEGPYAPSPEVNADLLEVGGRIFRGACVGCHGVKGDGEGREGKFLPIPPRDLTTGQFAVRSTPSGSLPLDSDLVRSLKRGFRPEVGMPSFMWLSDREIWAVVAHLKTLSPRWQQEKAPSPVEIPPTPARTPQSIKAGAMVYKETGCHVCHGELGRGDGPTARTLRCDTGKPILPPDFSKKGGFKGGSTPKDIYRTLTTGMDGTPMPSFDGSLTPEERWNLTFFILAFSEDEASAGR